MACQDLAVAGLCALGTHEQDDSPVQTMYDKTTQRFSAPIHDAEPSTRLSSIASSETRLLSSIECVGIGSSTRTGTWRFQARIGAGVRKIRDKFVHFHSGVQDVVPLSSAAYLSVSALAKEKISNAISRVQNDIRASIKKHNQESRLDGPPVPALNAKRLKISNPVLLYSSALHLDFNHQPTIPLGPIKVQPNDNSLLPALQPSANLSDSNSSANISEPYVEYHRELTFALLEGRQEPEKKVWLREQDKHEILAWAEGSGSWE